MTADAAGRAFRDCAEKRARWQEEAEAARERCLALLEQVTEALDDADARYHEQFAGDAAALKAFKRPEWMRLVRRARVAIRKARGED